MLDGAPRFRFLGSTVGYSLLGDEVRPINGRVLDPFLCVCERVLGDAVRCGRPSCRRKTPGLDVERFQARWMGFYAQGLTNWPQTHEKAKFTASVYMSKSYFNSIVSFTKVIVAFSNLSSAGWNGFAEWLTSRGYIGTGRQGGDGEKK